MDLLKQLREVAISVCPIALIALVMGLCFGVFSPDIPLWDFLFCVVLVIFGLSLFLLGVNLGFVPVGNHLGNSITRRKNLPLLLAVGFAIGLIITIAEPDVTVLTSQVVNVNPSINQTLLIVVIAAGVGLFMALSYLRTILGFSLKLSMAISIVLLFVVAAFVPEFFVSLGFDAGGATTGPLAVPFIMALGLGVSASRSESTNDSFGYTGLASIGPVLFVLILGALSKGDLSQGGVGESTLRGIPLLLSVFADVFKSLSPLIVICLLVQIFFMKLPKIKAIKIFMGILYSYLGISTFLFAVKEAFMPVATALGGCVANTNNWFLCGIGVVLGAAVVLAEPAIWVLTEQVEDVSQGTIRRGVMLIFISFGVAVAVLLSITRIILGLSIWDFLLPGYIMILALMPFTPALFVGIAFDSGGVATGPMSSTFLLPFVIGAAAILTEGESATASFGMIGLIAMMPVLTIEILGVIYSVKIKRVEK